MAAFFNLQSFSTDHESWFEYTTELSSNVLKRFVFRLVVFAATVNILCFHSYQASKIICESKIQHLLSIR